MDDKQLLPKDNGCEIEPIDDSDDDMYENPALMENQISYGGNINSFGGGNRSINAKHQHNQTVIIHDDDIQIDNTSNLSVHSSRLRASTDMATLNVTDDVPSLNLNDRRLRLILCSLILFIWCIPTLSLSLDAYENSDFFTQHNVRWYDYKPNQIHLSSMFIIITTLIFLLSFEIGFEFQHHILSIIIGFLLIIASILHLISTIVYINEGNCRNSITDIDNHTKYCWIGFIGTNFLGFLSPLCLGIDVIFSICNNKYIRLIIYTSILWITTLQNVVVITHFGNTSSCEYDLSNFSCIDNNLYNVLTAGYWLLMLASFAGMIEIILTKIILRWHKPRFQRLYMKLINLILGFSLICGVSFILIDASGCIDGQAYSDTADQFCYFKLTYVLVGFTIIIAYEFQTL